MKISIKIFFVIQVMLYLSSCTNNQYINPTIPYSLCIQNKYGIFTDEEDKTINVPVKQLYLSLKYFNKSKNMFSEIMNTKIIFNDKESISHCIQNSITTNDSFSTETMLIYMNNKLIDLNINNSVNTHYTWINNSEVHYFNADLNKNMIEKYIQKNNILFIEVLAENELYEKYEIIFENGKIKVLNKWFQTNEPSVAYYYYNKNNQLIKYEYFSNLLNKPDYTKEYTYDDYYLKSMKLFLPDQIQTITYLAHDENKNWITYEQYTEYLDKTSEKYLVERNITY